MSLFGRRRDPPPAGVLLRFELDREEDGRFIVDVVDLPGVMAYGATQDEAFQKAAALALRVIADRLERGEPISSSQGALAAGLHLDLQAV